MLNIFKKASAARRLLEEQLYEKVLHELAQGQIREGLWSKAVSNSDGVEEKAKALYIRYRVQSIKDESIIYGALIMEALKNVNEAHTIKDNNEDEPLMPLTTCRKCEQQFRMLKDTNHVNPICSLCLNKQD